ncbi:MAG: SulP family inorganic anion transporter [Candidatus Nanopelagicales bacterium]|nr:SulP family inorganic anion transporter [Candidatus Nanopelagicales bacterium]
MSSLASWVPGITAVRTYKRSWLPRDVMTGLVLSALLVPQGMAYAELAGLPAVTGLYTSILCLIGYAIFGPSRVLVLGPDSSLGPMIAATILPLAGAGGDPAKAVALASMLAIFTGLIMVAAGVGKLGFVADLLSKPTILGYMNGLALTIVVGQLPKLLGFSVDADGFLGELVGFFAGIWLPKIPAVLVAVIFAMVVSIAADLEARGVKLVGVLPQGLPQLTWPAVSFSDLLPLFGGALGIALVALTDTISTATSFAERRGELVDGDKEMIGIGASNVAAGLFQGFPVSTSGSRTAVADQAGGKSQLTGLVGAGVIAVMLLAVPGLFAALPQATLGAVVIMAAISLADIPATRRLWHQRKTDFVLSITAFLGVTLLGVLPGIAVAVMLSVANVFRRAWRPYQAELGKVPGMRGFHDTKRFDTYSLLPNAAILRFDAPLIFANSGTFRESVRAAAKRLPEGGWVIIAAEPITDVDTTACDMLDDLVADLDRTGKRLVLAELKDPVRTKLDAYGLEPDIPEDRFYPTLNEAVRACRDATGSQWQTQVREGTV